MKNKKKLKYLKKFDRKTTKIIRRHAGSGSDLRQKRPLAPTPAPHPWIGQLAYTVQIA